MIVPLLAHDEIEQLEATEELLHGLLSAISFENKMEALMMLANDTMQLMNEVIFDGMLDLGWNGVPAIACSHLPFIHFEVRKKRH